MKKALILVILLISTFILLLYIKTKPARPTEPEPYWQIRSIDTVKYSRDLSREKINDLSFNQTIDQQVKAIAQTGANYIAIGTPYDQEFMPFLSRWVQSARQNNLKIWFRGNFSGWEGWFDYPKISQATHQELLQKFIIENPDLFQDGDIFTSCPECENGGSGDPRQTRQIDQFRSFLIQEYQLSLQSFNQIHKNVHVGFYSMNYDVAELIMDPTTTKALGGIVTIDHYVASPDQLNQDINLLAQKSGGKIVLGEFGAPIPDIHGKLTPTEQSDWINKLLQLVSQNPNLVGLNYWTNVGGSTQLWNSDGQAFPAVDILTKFFTLH